MSGVRFNSGSPGNASGTRTITARTLITDQARKSAEFIKAAGRLLAHEDVSWQRISKSQTSVAGTYGMHVQALENPDSIQK